MIIEDSGENVVTLPVKPREDLGRERVLLVEHTRCLHFGQTYKVDERLAEVTCGGCGEKLNPMWVLEQLCREESRWHELHARYQDELKTLRARRRTKCEHCRQMTRIRGA